MILSHLLNLHTHTHTHTHTGKEKKKNKQTREQTTKQEYSTMRTVDKDYTNENKE